MHMMQGPDINVVTNEFTNCQIEYEKCYYYYYIILKNKVQLTACAHLQSVGRIHGMLVKISKITGKKLSLVDFLIASLYKKKSLYRTAKYSSTGKF